MSGLALGSVCAAAAASTCNKLAPARCLVNHQPVRWARQPRGTSRHKHAYSPPWIGHKRLLPHSVDERLTPGNRAFLKDLVRDSYPESGKPCAAAERKEVEAPVQWEPGMKRVGLLAMKVGMVPQWTTEGRRVLMTVLWVKDNEVVSVKPWAEWRASMPDEAWAKWWKNRRYMNDPLDKVVVGADNQDPRKYLPKYLRLFSKHGLMPKRRVTAFYLTPGLADGLSPGTPLDVRHFRVGDFVDCEARTVCHGFQGVVKRWGFKGGPATHGTTKWHRRPGSIGSQGVARVWPGKKMPGMMGGRPRTLRGIEVWRIDPELGLLYVRGPLPGPPRCWVRVWDTCVRNKWPNLSNGATPPPLPTYIPGDDVSAEEIFHPKLHAFGRDSTVEYKPEDRKVKKAVRNR